MSDNSRLIVSAAHWGLTVPLVWAQIRVICTLHKTAAQRSVVHDVGVPAGLTLSRALARNAALAIADRQSGTWVASDRR